MLLGVNTFAQKANMIFYTANEEKFYLVINGIQQNAEPLTNIKVTDMNAPIIYSIRLKFANPAILTVDDKVSVQPSMEKTWIVQPKKIKNIVSTNEYIVKTMSEIDITDVPANVNFQPNQVIVYHTQVLPQQDGVAFNMNVNDNSANVSFNIAVPQNEISMVSAEGHENNSYKVIGTEIQDIPANNITNSGCLYPLNELAFKTQLERAKSQTTTSGKQIVAEKIAQQNCLTAKQVYELCYALVLNNDKLTLAKFCYTRCFDPQNYEEVYKAMTTNIMVKDLDAYVNSQSQNNNIHLQPIKPTRQTVVTSPVYNGALGCAMPMANNDFNAAKETIANANFEATKISTAKTIVSANCLTVNQVIAITKLFDFEASKLEFAKYAYQHTYDKGNYFKINTVFDFDASKQEMNRFVSRGGK